MAVKKEDVKALLAAEKEKKVADASAAVSAEFEALQAQVDALPEVNESDVVAQLKAALAQDEQALADAKVKLQQDEDLLAKLRALLS
jgi:hypothetical protein